MGKFKLKLSFLIVCMTIMVVLATSGVSIWSSYQSVNEILMEHFMQDRYVKGSSAIKDGYLEDSMKEDITLEPFWEQVASNEKIIPFSLFLKKVFVPIVLVIAIVVVLAIWLALKIVRPLNELSTMIEAGENRQGKEHIADWYDEAKLLKKNVQNMMICAESKITDLTDQLNLDSLTGIPNRRIMDQTLNELFINKVPHSVILIDLDDFKSINDTYGHTVGDEVLKAFAHHMQLNMEEQGMCFRYGGEEFMIILPSRSIDEAVELAESLRVKQALQETACGRPVTMSAGITAFTPNVQSPNQLIEIADHALYKAKQSGRNCLCVVRNMRQMIIKS